MLMNHYRKVSMILHIVYELLPQGEHDPAQCLWITTARWARSCTVLMNYYRKVSTILHSVNESLPQGEHDTAQCYWIVSGENAAG